jgi:predicted PurR-regulated permease PerM
MNSQPQPQFDLTRIVLLVLIIGVLIAASLWTLLPFLGAFIWAAMIVVATWPLMMRVQGLVGGRRSIATAVMTGVMLLIFIVPFSLAIGTLFDAAAQGVDLANTYLTQGLGQPPAWITGLPWVGTKIAAEWQELAAGGAEGLTTALQPYARSAASWVLSMTGGIGMVILHFMLTILIAAILYSQGEFAAKGVLMFAHRIGKERGEKVIHLAGMAVRGVALGVIVTALVQSLLAGVGLWVSGVPRPGLLLAVVFALCIAQLGPIPVLLPAVIWLYWSDSFGWATALLVWTIIVGTLDNILRPILIRRGVDLPLLLIIAGVIGGLIGFGVVGLFVGPVILAVTYTLLESWVLDDNKQAGQ